jgi:hypothetical protein
MGIGVHDRFEVPSRNLTHRNSQRMKPFGDVGSTTTGTGMPLITRLGDKHL